MSNELEKFEDNHTIVLRNETVGLDSDVGRAFLNDACRNEEGIFSDDDLKQKWKLTDAEAAAIIADEFVVDAVRAECQRRLWSGLAVKEAAVEALSGAPARLKHMLHDKLEASARRIDSVKVLKDLASGNTPEGMMRDQFVIRIVTSINDPEHPPVVVNIPAPPVETPQPPIIIDDRTTLPVPDELPAITVQSRENPEPDVD